jgi:hypothetical protein
MDKLPLIRSRWKRLLLGAYLSWLVFFGRLQSSRAHVHWIGHVRPPRRERLLLAVLLIVFLPLAIFVLEQNEFLIWSITWGSVFVLAINSYMIYRLVPRRKHHWAGSK